MPERWLFFNLWNGMFNVSWSGNKKETFQGLDEQEPLCLIEPPAPKCSLPA
jgi:hypothetical protein